MDLAGCMIETQSKSMPSLESQTGMCLHCSCFLLTKPLTVNCWAECLNCFRFFPWLGTSLSIRESLTKLNHPSSCPRIYETFYLFNLTKIYWINQWVASCYIPTTSLINTSILKAVSSFFGFLFWKAPFIIEIEEILQNAFSCCRFGFKTNNTPVTATRLDSGTVRRTVT